MDLILSRALKAAIACSIALAPVAAHGEPPDAAAGVMAALREAEAGQDLRSRDYVLGRKLSADGEARHAFNVNKGETYLVLGACNEACEDIDIVAEDAAGNVVGYDEAYGADPFVVFLAQRTGRISVILSMKECGEDACEYGLGFYSLADRKPAPE